MKKTIAMQSIVRSQLDNSQLCSFDLKVASGPSSPLIHPNACFWLIRGGKAEILLQGKKYAVGRGDLVAILPWQISQITAVDDPIQYAVVVYHFDTVSHAARLFHSASDESLPIEAQMQQCPVAHLSEQQAADAENIAQTLRRELGVESSLTESAEPLYSSIATVSLLVNLIILFLRAAFNPSEPARTQVPDDREILRYMYLHCNEKLTLQKLADIFYCGKSTISNRIMEMTGLSFFDLLNEMRVGKTANYLLYTDLTLKELAEILGYVDESHISKVFAARLGTKLGEYRSTYQRVENICQVEESRLGYSLVNHVYRNYASDLRAGEVAQKFGISVEKLNRTMLYQTERNFEEFLGLIRVNRACELLASTRKTVLDIALDVGFHNQKTFTRNFLKHRQMTPSAYRAAVQKPGGSN